MEHIWLGKMCGNTEQGTGWSHKKPAPRVAAGLGVELLS